MSHEIGHVEGNGTLKKMVYHQAPTSGEEDHALEN